MMKPRTQFFMIIGLITLILGITWYSFSKRAQEPVQFFPATVNRDCGPWDGSAFTVSIPMDAGTSIDISIWQSPDIKFPKTFSFPDDTGQVGNALFRSRAGEYEVLSGEVRFESVSEAMPLAGRFSLKSASGGKYIGQFTAEWGSQMAFCG